MQKREIKFRAFINVGLGDNDKDVYEMTYDLAFEDYEPINHLLSNVQNLMQFTGLRDKNGVEIYEGDIVQTVAPDGARLSKFEIFWSTSGCGFYKRREDGECFTLDVHQTLLQIIGNIYEHPHLLK